MHIVCVLMELWPLSRSISKIIIIPRVGEKKVVEAYKLNLLTLVEFSFFSPPLNHSISPSPSPSPCACHSLIHILFILPLLPISLRLCQDVSQPLASLLFHLFLPYFLVTPCVLTLHPLRPSSPPWSQIQTAPCFCFHKQEEAVAEGGGSEAAARGSL